MYKIEKNVPVQGMGRPRIYPFEKMEAGDSFFVKGDEKKIHSVRQRMMIENRACQTHKWISRTVQGGIRIWCMEK